MKKKALKWFDSLSNDDKIWAMMKAGYDKRHPNNLTSDEITEMWCETQENAVEDSLKNRGSQRSPFGIGS